MSYYNPTEGIKIRLFFEQTSTKNRALEDIIKDKNLKKYRSDKYDAITYLIDKENISTIISAILTDEIDNRTTIFIYDTLAFLESSLAKKLKEGISHKFSILPPYKQKDIYTDRREKDFQLLFDLDALKDKLLEVFKLKNKDALTKKEIYLRTRDNKLQHFNSNLVFEILNDFAKAKKDIVNKQQVLNWFDNKENVEHYVIERLYHLLKRDDFDKRLNDTQKQWFINWINKNISKIEFSTAITIKSDDSFSVNYLAQWVYFFSLKLNLRHSNSIMLDMLLFVWTDSEENNSNINYINNWVSSELIIERMLINLRLGIKSSIIRKKHLKYLLEEGIVESYSFIVSEILNEDDNTFLISYWEKTKNIEVFKELFTKSNSEIKWRILDILLEQGEFSFCLKQLKTLLHNHHSQEEALTILKYLISIGNIDGLKRFIKHLKDNKFYIDKGFNTSYLTFSLDALPHLMELLEMCYKHDITFDYQENLYLSVYNLIKSTALLSEKNYSVVREKLQAFLDLNHKKYKYVKYLNHRLQELDQEFYKNNTITLTIAEVKEQISIKN